MYNQELDINKPNLLDFKAYQQVSKISNPQYPWVSDEFLINVVVV